MEILILTKRPQEWIEKLKRNFQGQVFGSRDRMEFRGEGFKVLMMAGLEQTRGYKPLIFLVDYWISEREEMLYVKPAVICGWAIKTKGYYELGFLENETKN